MESVEKSIEVDAPVSKVYNQWTQFEEFPRFMEGVAEVRQLDDKRLHWVAEISGKRKEWNAEIFEQIPDQRIAWRSTTGAKNSGMVNFYPLGEERTRVTLKLNYDPQGAMDSVGDMLGVRRGRGQGGSPRFQAFVQTRALETAGRRCET